MSTQAAGYRATMAAQDNEEEGTSPCCSTYRRQPACLQRLKRSAAQALLLFLGLQPSSPA